MTGLTFPNEKIDNTHPHMTLYTANEFKAVDSNYLAETLVGKDGPLY